MTSETVRLTTAQAIVRYLSNQFIEFDGMTTPLFAGAFGIFGHGNVTCLSEALLTYKNELPTWRGQNEQSMALAAIGYAKAKLRRQIMIATTSIGPGATNMVTAAGVAHTNRLPVLFLCGDTFTNRLPDPVLQQIENFGCPSTSANDCFKPVSRYWDRITHPAQILSSIPQAIATMLDPADCGPAFIGLPQDIQENAFDYPVEFFFKKVWHISKPRAPREQIVAAAELLCTADKPLIIAGGGVRYSGAHDAVDTLAAKRNIPIAETIAGKGTIIHNHPNNVGALGIEGTDAAKKLAEEADVIIAIGTRLQDFTTGSWTTFGPETRFININAARFDAHKHFALAVVGDAKETIYELDSLLGNWKCPDSHLKNAQKLFRRWNEAIETGWSTTNTSEPTYAQLISIVNKTANKNDTIITAAGGLPGEAVKNWRVKSPNTFDCEFGFSCMGYEIAAGWGHAMAKNGEGTPIVMVGDGTYMMMNSDIYSSVLTGHKQIVVVCDNGGYGVINRLQTNMGIPGFNNLLKDCHIKNSENPMRVEFAEHAKSMGALSRHCNNLSEFEDAMMWAQTTDKTTVITISSDAHTWTPGGADWYVGVPEISNRDAVRNARSLQATFRKSQRRGI